MGSAEFFWSGRAVIISVPTNHHNLALKLFSQAETPVFEMHHLGVEVPPVLPLLLRWFSSAKRRNEAEMPDKGGIFGLLSRDSAYFIKWSPCACCTAGFASQERHLITSGEGHCQDIFVVVLWLCNTDVLALCSPCSVCLFVPWHLAELLDMTLCNISAIEH